MVMVGEKIIVVPTGMEDLPRLFEMRSLPSIIGYMDDELDFAGRAETMGTDPFLLYQQHTVQQMLNGHWYFSLWLKSPVTLVGTFYSTQIFSDGTIVPTILIDRKYWGKGIAEDAGNVMFKWAFQDKLRHGLDGYKMVLTYINNRNTRAKAYAKSMGLKEYGIHPRPEEDRVQVMYAISKPEWLALRQSQNDKPAKKKRGRPKKEEVEA
ncbi:hypothetical protein LCGC14_1591450 [marine sediment metagenome]|uniref:N-acetyltransferase domain-containing protein n=1 Tax=marine sediment metagenome TaxID=412755 RepID=A0A0F9IDS4_9ZZZZ